MFFTLQENTNIIFYMFTIDIYFIAALYWIISMAIQYVVKPNFFSFFFTDKRKKLKSHEA